MKEGKEQLVIKKTLVDLDSPAFQHVVARRGAWEPVDCFASPGPRQLWGPTVNQVPMTVAMNQGYKTLKFRF
jgi:pyrophosphate--fructose-6-phosphate 1-phosphotransferase